MKNFKHYFILLLSIMASSFVNGQNDFETGLIFDNDAYNDLPSVSYEDLGAKGRELKKEVDLRKWLPEIAHQRSVASCVGWASGYGALTAMYAQSNNWTSKEKRTQEAFSAMFIYNQIKKGGCKSGATIEDAGAFLMNNGDCKSKDFDIENLINCSAEPSERIKALAMKYRIKGFLSVFEATDKASKKVFKIKKNLSDGFPVVVGMNIRHNFKKVKGEYWQPDVGSKTPLGGHAMVVVGYQDKKQAFLVMNSWGKKWGNDGFIWIKYDDFKQYIQCAYRFVVDDAPVIDTNNTNATDVDEKKLKAAYNGKFRLRGIDYLPDETYEFRYEKAEKSKGYVYRLEKKDWEIGDQYQLLLDKPQMNRAVYIFSIDAMGANVHWPRTNTEEKSIELYGAGESSLVTLKDLEIIIPTKEDVLVKQIEGDDNIIVLYSYLQIKDFKERVLRVKNASGDIETRFLAGFEDIVIPSSQINYAPNQLEFSSSAPLDRFVVPVILRLEGE